MRSICVYKRDKVGNVSIWIKGFAKIHCIHMYNVDIVMWIFKKENYMYTYNELFGYMFIGCLVNTFRNQYRAVFIDWHKKNK